MSGYNNTTNVQTYAYSRAEVDQKLRGLQPEKMPVEYLSVSIPGPFNSLNNATTYLWLPDATLVSGYGWQRWATIRTGGLGGIEINDISGRFLVTAWVQSNATGSAMSAFLCSILKIQNPGAVTTVNRPVGLAMAGQSAGGLATQGVIKLDDGDDINVGLLVSGTIKSMAGGGMDLILLGED